MKRIYPLLLILSIALVSVAQQQQSFIVSLPDPSSQQYHVQMVCSGFTGKTLTLSLPNWTPGYYQMLNYAQYINDVSVVDENGKLLPWKKSSNNTWSIEKGKSKSITITYTAKATIPFVAQNLLDAEHGYIMPAGIFMHAKGYLNNPVTLTIRNYPQWSTIATGLEPVSGSPNTFSAPDFDTFYDSPILLGNLEQLKSFNINNIPHHFIGYKLGAFDKDQFINDLQKIVGEATKMIGDIPYTHYTFLAIGPVPGGIEHLNSTGFGFSSNDFQQRERLLRMYTFLSHEYFHHYNAKRIRPIELGPFDYDNGSKTTMLWIAEGLTNYYDELLTTRAGVMTEDEYLNSIRSLIQLYENKPGRMFQTAADASYQTWSDGPFGRTGDDAYKTISVYEKGSLMGLALDFNIRHETQNKQSLDDVMRYVYNEYYKKLNRGFTEAEFKAAAEKIAGIPLTEFFDYVNTVKPMDLKKYLSYAGLSLKEENVELPDPYVGLNTRVKNDTLVVTSTDWNSPAWETGIRAKQVIAKVNGELATKERLSAALKTNQPVQITVMPGQKEITLTPTKKKERQFTISKVENPSDLQKQIFERWLGKE